MEGGGGIKQPVGQSNQSILPGSVVHGELQHSFVKDGVSVDVDVLGDSELGGGADPHTLRQSQEGLHPTGAVVP